MNKTACAFTLVMVFCAIAFAQSAPKTDVFILVPNCSLFPVSNVKSGATLPGLYYNRDRYVVEPTKIVVDTFVDTQGQQVMRVYAKGNRQPVLLISGLDVKPGPVKTVYSGGKFLFPGESLPIYLSDQPKPKDNYVLKAYGNAVRNSDQDLIYDYSMKLLRDNQSQTLDYYKPGVVERALGVAVLNVSEHTPQELAKKMNLPVLVWAGDLDGDNKLDLFTWWPCPGKSGGVYSLFFSSTAPEGKLVTKVSAGARTYNDKIEAAKGEPAK